MLFFEFVDVDKVVVEFGVQLFGDGVIVDLDFVNGELLNFIEYGNLSLFVVCYYCYYYYCCFLFC